MKKNKIFIVLALVVMVAVPFSVFAATSDTPAAKSVRGFFGIDPSKLTDQQKSNIKDYCKKMANLQKEFVNSMVANGTMTKEQGDAAIKKIDDMQKYQEENGFTGGFFMGKGSFGRKGEFKAGGFDISMLTDQQKADLKESFKKLTDLQKEFISKMVANGMLTKEQGEAATKKVDAMVNNLDSNNAAYGMMAKRGGFEGFGFFGIAGIDTSKLTDQQRTELTDFFNKMADIQKELVNKMVANGSMTKEQGDAAINKIDAMLKFHKENGFSKGMGMKKGRYDGHGKQGGRNEKGSTTPTT